VLAIIDRSAPVLSADYPGRAAVLRALDRASVRVEADGPDELLRTLNATPDPGAIVLTVGRLSTLTAALSSFCTRRAADAGPVFAHLGGTSADDAHACLGWSDDPDQRCDALLRALQRGTSRSVPVLRVEATDIAHVRLGFQAASGAAIPVVRAAQSEGALRERLGGAASLLRQLGAARGDLVGQTSVELDGNLVTSPDYCLLASHQLRLGPMKLGDAPTGYISAMAGRMDEVRTLMNPGSWLRGNGFRRQTRTVMRATLQTDSPWMLDGWLHVPDSRAVMQAFSGGSVRLLA
jgi:hypothetical protein